MKNVIVKLSELTGELKQSVQNLLKESDPEVIAFPYRGKHVRGFIYSWKDISYLIIQNVVSGGNIEDDFTDFENVEFD